MDDKAFAAFVKTNAVRMELETLQSIVSDLSDLIAQRRSGKPPGLRVGSPIEAVHLGFETYTYGEVVRFTEKGCIVQTPGGYEERIRFDKYAVRILSDSDWGWIGKRLEEDHEKARERIADEADADRAELEQIINNRDNPKRRVLKATFADGVALDIYEGAYLHVYRTDWEHHIYGFVLSLSPKSCFVRSRSMEYDEKVHFAKCIGAELLSDEQWTRVESELERRCREVDNAEKSGRTKIAQTLAQKYEGAEVMVR